MSKRTRRWLCVVAILFGLCGTAEAIRMILNNAGLTGWLALCLGAVSVIAPFFHWRSETRSS